MTPQSTRLRQSTVQLSPHDAVQSFMSWHSTVQSCSHTAPQLPTESQPMLQPSPEQSKKQKASFWH